MAYIQRNSKIHPDVDAAIRKQAKRSRISENYLLNKMLAKALRLNIVIAQRKRKSKK